MRYIFKFFCLLLLLNSCSNSKLDYSKIDFETRKIIKDSWYEYDNLEIERVSEQEKKKYKYYESEIKSYKKSILKNLEYLDSLRNHKSIVLNNIKQRQEARTKGKESNNSELGLGFSTPEEEYDFFKDLNNFELKDNRKILDSLNNLYNTISENDKYYKLDYIIKFNSDKSEGTKKLELEILVDNNSEIFDYKWL